MSLIIFAFNDMTSCFSEMFVETGKFSTRTLAAIKNLDGAAIRHKNRDPQDYQWRKDMER